MTKTFQEFAAENLAGFGFSIAATDIPEYQVTVEVINALSTWANSLDEKTWAVIRGADLADGLWYEGFFAKWEQLYSLFKGASSARSNKSKISPRVSPAAPASTRSSVVTRSSGAAGCHRLAPGRAALS
jgi:hypothetical protein